MGCTLFSTEQKEYRTSQSGFVVIHASSLHLRHTQEPQGANALPRTPNHRNVSTGTTKTILFLGNIPENVPIRKVVR